MGRQSGRQREDPGRKRHGGRKGPGPRRGSGGSDGGATAQLHNHLLAVTAGTAVTHLLQGAGSFSQQHCSLARGRQEREGKMAAGQQDGSSSLSLARPGVYLSCGNEIYISTVPRSSHGLICGTHPLVLWRRARLPSLSFSKGRRLTWHLSGLRQSNPGSFCLLHQEGLRSFSSSIFIMQLTRFLLPTKSFCSHPTT